MKNLLILGVLCAVGCAAAKAAPAPGESASSIALTYAVMQSDVAPAPEPAPGLRCNGTKVIRHGDGHTSPCPGCVDCEAKAKPLITPAVYLRKQAPVIPPVDRPACECVATTGSCECAPVTILPASGNCADGSCAAPTKRVTSSGSCASGSCGSSSAQSGGPVRRVFKGIRERRPVRRLFGRLFGR